VQDLDAATASLVFTFGMGMRWNCKGALSLAISRVIEERVGHAVGVADVRKWLIIIGEVQCPGCTNRHMLRESL